MKDLTLSLRRLACCMSLEATAEPGERVASPSLTSTRSPTQSPNEKFPAHTQEATYRSGISRRSSTLDDSDERVAARSTPSTSKRTLPQSERQESPQRTTETVLCPLERLPVEAQTCILAESTLGSLRALIRSSPRFYCVYSQDRLPLLKKALNCALDGIFLDAYAACRSDSSLAHATGIPCFSLSDILESPDTALWASAIDGLSIAVAQQMASFHLRVVEPLTERYARWALGALSSSPQEAPLTMTEKSRIQRAMYRLQVICNLGIWDEQTILQVLDSFGPWAAEQVICVHEFSKERWTSVFFECAWELDEDETPRYYHLAVDVNEKLLLNTTECPLNVGTLRTMLSLGLSVLQETFQAEGLEDLCAVTSFYVENGGWGPGPEWIDGAVGDWGHQFEYHAQFFSEHDEPQDTEQEMRFEQDDLLSPPLAWVTFWNGRHSNQIGTYIPHALHRWGYVMWDAKRLEDSGAIEYIELEWQCKYGMRGSPEEDDPREYYISRHQPEIANGN